MADLREIFADLATGVSLVGGYTKPEGSTYGKEGADEVITLFQFCEKGFGFCIKQTRDGVFVDTEMMGIDKIKQYIGLLLDTAITDTDDDMDKHRLYCAVMNRVCGPACRQCGGLAQLERIEAQLAERLGLTGNVRERLSQLAKDNQLVEDELVSDWHAAYAWYLEWQKEQHG